MLSTGDRYSGSFVNHLRQGHGSHHWANGDHYVGQFENDAFHGHGTKTYVGDTPQQTGQWINHVFQG
jgi:hypothetical protein